MDFEQLKAFLEVARSSSFSRAAEKLFRTQPAISAQIRTLETEIGARLFDRSGGRVKLTAGGKLFLQYAEQALQSKRNIIRAVADLERTPRGDLVVSANEATCLYILPQVFAQFKEQYPRVAVSIARNERAGTLEAVLSQEVDFGAVSVPVNNPRLTVLPIHKDGMVVITPPAHPLLRQGKAKLEEISKYPLLLPKQGRTRDTIDQLFFRHQLKADISMELDSSELLKRFVAVGVGVGFLARSNTVADCKAGLIGVVELVGACIERDLALVYRKDKSLSRAAKAFIEIAQQTHPEPRMKRTSSGEAASPSALKTSASK
ncbi:MAG TPA: LysR family transcriptional regulator [Acidobacteriaceae bacterium]|jgi:DNA-binding transcriptional LysR family regulator|nr:LysR family transcriptional regulator [Acidobacteriaceae bacterium]